MSFKEEFKTKITNILWDIIKTKAWENTNEDMNEIFTLFKIEIKKLTKPIDILRDLTVDIEKREIYTNYHLDNELDRLVITNIISCFNDNND